LQLINELRTRQTIRKATELHNDGKAKTEHDKAVDEEDGELDVLGHKSRAGTSKVSGGSRKMSVRGAEIECAEDEESEDEVNIAY
jgi:hypothetical protein